MQLVIGIVVALVVARWLAESGLAVLNCRQVLAHADRVPEAYREVVDEATYAKSVKYTLARLRFGWFDDTYRTLILLLVLFSGVLPWGFAQITQHLGTSAWAMAAGLMAGGVGMWLPGLPVDWLEQFKLEQKFGFNTTTPKLWWQDRLKGWLLALALGYPLLVLLLKFVEWTGDAWWFWAWVTVLAFQFLMMVLAPVLILPLFNRFTPLAEGALRDRLVQLAERTKFHAQSIQVMDGSKRSRHSNAFFTGFGRFRKIVLFDTLMAQLDTAELEAVLAHEIGHYRKRHIPQRLFVGALGSLAGFYLMAVLARQEWFYQAFGFAPGPLAPALLLFALLAGAVTFWLSPVLHGWSRRHEYEADAFAAEVMNDPTPLIRALRKLSENNLSNLTPHPWYSGFYYSHPTVLEREQALARRT